MVIEVDQDGTLDPALGVAGRIPETGRIAVEVRRTGARSRLQPRAPGCSGVAKMSGEQRSTPR